MEPIDNNMLEALVEDMQLRLPYSVDIAAKVDREAKDKLAADIIKLLRGAALKDMTKGYRGVINTAEYKKYITDGQHTLVYAGDASCGDMPRACFTVRVD